MGYMLLEWGFVKGDMLQTRTNRCFRHRYIIRRAFQIEIQITLKMTVLKKWITKYFEFYLPISENEIRESQVLGLWSERQRANFMLNHRNSSNGNLADPLSQSQLTHRTVYSTVICYLKCLGVGQAWV